MPNCFQLIRKTTGEAARFQDIDTEMCAHFNVPCHPTEWYGHWYDIIGWSCAVEGLTLEQQIAERPLGRELEDFEARHLAILNWLNEHFTSDAWAAIGR